MVCEISRAMAHRPPSVRPFRPHFQHIDLSIYLIANRPSCKNDAVFFSRIQEAVKGGVTCVQFRDHVNPHQEIVRAATHLKSLIKGVPLFINTPKMIDVAKTVKAAGIFIEDTKHLRCQSFQKLLNETLMVGLSVWSMPDVYLAQQLPNLGYLSVKISPSRLTCRRNDSIWGKEGLRHLRELVRHRIVAVGGLGIEHAEEIYRMLHTKDGIAMAGGLMEAESPYLTAKQINEILNRVRNRP